MFHLWCSQLELRMRTSAWLLPVRSEFCPHLISHRTAFANLISAKSILFAPQTPQDEAVIRNNNGEAVLILTQDCIKSR